MHKINKYVKKQMYIKVDSPSTENEEVKMML